MGWKNKNVTFVYTVVLCLYHGYYVQKWPIRYIQLTTLDQKLGIITTLVLSFFFIFNIARLPTRDSFFVVSFHLTFREEVDRFILVGNYIFVTKNPNDLKVLAN